MQQLECVTFYISYDDILLKNTILPYDGEGGKMNAKRTDVSWYNFNIGEMLQDYGDYQYFNLRLSSVMTQLLGTWANTANLNVCYMLSGFDFVNQSHDIEKKSEIEEVPLVSIIEASERQYSFQNLNHTIRFKKGLSNDKIRLRLRVLRTVDDNSNDTATISTSHPRLHFIFNIYPIE